MKSGFFFSNLRKLNINESLLICVFFCVEIRHTAIYVRITTLWKIHEKEKVHVSARKQESNYYLNGKRMYMILDLQLFLLFPVSCSQKDFPLWHSRKASVVAVWFGLLYLLWRQEMTRTHREAVLVYSVLLTCCPYWQKQRGVTV